MDNNFLNMDASEVPNDMVIKKVNTKPENKPNLEYMEFI